MNDLELKKLWQSIHISMADGFDANQMDMKQVTQKSVHHFIKSMKLIKLIAIAAGAIWVILGVKLLVPIYMQSFSQANKFFLFSISIQIVLTAMAWFIYVFQLLKIYTLPFDAPILKTQKHLAQLKITSLWSTRILCLQLPCWTTFWWNETMFTNWNYQQWAITLAATSLFTLVAIWLFFNITYENRNKPWFKLLFAKLEWTPILKAIALLEQLEEYSPKKTD